MLKLGSSLEARTVLKPNEGWLALHDRVSVRSFFSGEHTLGKACLSYRDLGSEILSLGLQLLCVVQDFLEKGFEALSDP